MKHPRKRGLPRPGELKETSAPVAQHRAHILGILALWALILVAYSNSFQTGLVLDSPVMVHDARVQALTTHNLKRILTEPYWPGVSTSGLYRPITTFSYLFNYSILGNGTQTAGYHWANLLLHLLNVTLVCLLASNLIGYSAALAVAGLWGLHPLLTESVTNVAGRADLLAAFGVLAGLLCYLKSPSAPDQRKNVWATALMLFQTIGIFSKENAIVLPAVMLLYDLTWKPRFGWRERLPSYSAVALPIAAFFFMRIKLHVSMTTNAIDNPLITSDFWTARLTAFKVIAKYLGLFVWPARLSADYSHNAVSLFGWRASRWEDVSVLVGLGLCLSAVALSIGWHRSRKPQFFFLAFFFVTFAPTSNLVILIGSIMAERFLYLPSIGLIGCLVASVWSTVRQSSLHRQRLSAGAAGAASALLLLAGGIRTYARNLDWMDEYSLWSSAVRASPGSAKAHKNLGAALAVTPGRLPEAIAQYRTAVRIAPNFAEAHYDLGVALSQTPGGINEAIEHYEEALRLEPGAAAVHNNLAAVLSRLPGRLPESLSHYEEALRIQPDYGEAHNNLGVALTHLPGRSAEAIAHLQAALRLLPASAELHNNLGVALAQQDGRLADAIAEYEAALRLDPKHARTHKNLGDALAQLPDRLPEAVAHYDAALRVRPDPAVQNTADRLRARLVNTTQK